MSEVDALFSLAEIAVTMAGFSAVVVVFRRRDASRWSAADADRFNGMLVHSMTAAFFCILPSILAAFTRDPHMVWAWASGLIGVQIAAHVTGVLLMSTTDRVGRALVGLGYLVAGLQGMNVVEWGYAREFRPFLLGVVWHVFQAGVLFVVLIILRREDLEET